MKRLALLSTGLALVLGGGLFIWLSNPVVISAAELAKALPADFLADPVRGEEIFRAGGCANCHSADALADRPILAGGAALETQFGTFQPSNITPHPVNGIGAWSDAQFITALVNGVSPRGKHYYPAFPYDDYQNVTWSDLLHLRAHLADLPESDVPSPNHDLIFPFNIRLGVGVWKAAFGAPQFDPASVSDDPNVQRGAYLAEGLGHCGSCHTPRTIFQAEDPNRAFHGAKALKAGEFSAPKLAGESEGKILGGFDEFAFSVRENSSMWHVTETYSAFVPYDDHEAIAAYLSGLPSPR